MAEELPRQIYGNTIKYLIAFTIVMVVFTLALVSYSREGYTLTRVPGGQGSAIICVEGEVDPTNQSVTIINDDPKGTLNPWVEINGEKYVFDMLVEEVGVRKKAWSLKLGCNNVTYGADTDTRFRVRLEYMSHWRPRIRYLEIGNLMVGHSARYFLDTGEDPKRIQRSRLNITALEREYVAPEFDEEFNGTSVRFKMDEPGNYVATMQVYDGYVWSDVYESGYTAHVIVTNEQKNAQLAYELEDDPVLEHPAMIPLEVRPDDVEPFKSAKRGVNGAYMLGKKTWTLIKTYLPI